MQDLINSYTTNADSASLSHDFINIQAFNLNNQQSLAWSILLRNPSRELGFNKNAKYFLLLDDIALLKENWDEDDGLAPQPETIQYTRALISWVSIFGVNIFNIAPGPMGEIMIDFRAGEKSIEILIYSDKKKFVKFSDQEKPKQGDFNPALLPELISWLNS